MNKNIQRPELLLPGGSFQSACAALESGANAVYIGLKNFSARARAENFSFSQLRKLRSLANKTNSRIFAAFNTIIKENELLPAIENIYEARLCGIDAVIIQDYGLVNPLKKALPSLPLHASTQMAVHNSRGVQWLKDIGFSRVILSRELSVKEIIAIRKAHPDIELEVFIHGAMCYGFSGLCLASGSLLGRSGNRGQCAQICRTWFTENKTPGYFFSSKDLALNEEILTLANTGIDSLKIEGRMKGPVYTSKAAAYYKSILNGNPDKELKKGLSVSFSRTTSKAFWEGETLNTEADYPGHRGILAGKVLDTARNSFKIRAEESLGIRDGLFFLKPQKNKISAPINFAIRHIQKDKKNLSFLKKGESGWIYGLREQPLKGTVLRLISRHDQEERSIKESSLQEAAFPLDLAIKITKDNLILKTKVFGYPLKSSFPILIEEAKKPGHIEDVLLKKFKASGAFTTESIQLEQPLPYEGRVFINPSSLKVIRNQFYTQIEKELPQIKAQILLSAEKSLLQDILPVPDWAHPVPERQDMNVDHSFSYPENFIPQKINYVPLLPVLFDAEDYLNKWEILVKNHPDCDFVFGLSNPGHIVFALKLAEAVNVSFFLDYGFYIANKSAALFFLHNIPKLLFMYSWIEGSENFTRNFNDSLPPEIKRRLRCFEKSFNPPLFISRSEPDISKNWEAEERVTIEQNDHRYRICHTHNLFFLFPDTALKE